MVVKENALKEKAGAVEALGRKLQEVEAVKVRQIAESNRQVEETKLRELRSRSYLKHRPQFVLQPQRTTESGSGENGGSTKGSGRRENEVRRAAEND